MLHLIPNVKKQEIRDRFLKEKAICYNLSGYDKRLLLALGELPYSANGAKLEIKVEGAAGEGYELQIEGNKITITANGSAGLFMQYRLCVSFLRMMKFRAYT